MLPAFAQSWTEVLTQTSASRRHQTANGLSLPWQIQPDVLLELALPLHSGLDVFEVLERRREHTRPYDVPIIMVASDESDPLPTLAIADTAA
jgi:hypothetical protein